MKSDTGVVLVRDRQTLEGIAQDSVTPNTTGASLSKITTEVAGRSENGGAGQVSTIFEIASTKQLTELRLI